MAFDVYDCSLSLLRTLVPLLERLATQDAKLADQLRRAAQSVALNIAEANQRTGRDRRNRFRIALGSLRELGAALDVAAAFGWLPDAPYAAEHDRLCGVLYGLQRG